MKKLDLTALLERVRNATGPDRELDADILIALECIDEAPWDIIVGRDVINKLSSRTYSHPAPITYSVDAALALVERVLPGGMNMVLKLQTGGEYFHAEYETDDGDVTAYNHPSLPLAILTALLLALTSNQKGNDEA